MPFYTTQNNRLLREDEVAYLLCTVLKIAVAGCFIGHGVFGVIGKKEWLPFFAFFSIDKALAIKLMPVIGLMDISVGVAALIFPTRATLIWMAIWAFWTAMLRPLIGMGNWELFERAGNYGVPLAFLMLSDHKDRLNRWFVERVELESNLKSLESAHWILRISTALLLLGHGGFGAIMQKRLLMEHWGILVSPFGLHDPRVFVAGVGWAEMVLAAAVLIKPHRRLLLGVFAWKVFTELFYPLTGHLVWEFIERFGSYLAPITLIYVHQLITMSSRRVPSKVLNALP